MRLYFDYASSTPVDSKVEAAMRPYFSRKFGNPGSLHSFGQEAMAAVDHSRETVAHAIGALFREVVFTGSATEANNLVVRGAVKAARQASHTTTPFKIIISPVEHESVLETAADVEKEGVEVVRLPVDHEGVVDVKKLQQALDDRTVLVSVMYANNEIGTIEPVAAIGKIIQEYREARGGVYPAFHTDAVQALQFLDCNVATLGVDFMTLSAHKIYGPKGIGVLYVRTPVAPSHPPLLNPIVTGGGQEFGLRSGTENVPSIVGFEKALELILKNREAELLRIQRLRDYFWHTLRKIYPHAERNTPERSVLPNILNVYFPRYEAEGLLAKFDLRGLSVSAGSACSARSARQSHVVRALGYDRGRARRSIRFSFGRPTTKGEVDSALKIVRMSLKNR